MYLLDVIKSFLAKLKIKKYPRQKDNISIDLPGLSIKMNRELFIDVPHEITIVLPRIELRKKYTESNGTTCESEIIYNSITVVSAPQHPLAGTPKNLK